MAIDLTEKLLNEAGGWQAMKQARALLEMGRVAAFHYDAPLLRGLVRDGPTEFRAGLRIAGKSNIENICSCRESREWGTICAHSLAVGLAVLRAKAPVQPLAAPAAPKVAPTGPFFSTAAPENLAAELHVILPLNLPTAWEKGQLVTGIEAESANRRVLINALDPRTTFHCGPEDVPLAETLRRIGGGAVPGMLILTRESFLELLASLRGHPRVTFGKNILVAIDTQPTKPRLAIHTDSHHQLHLRLELPENSQLLAAGPRRWLFTDNHFTEIAPGLPAEFDSLFSAVAAATAVGAPISPERLSTLGQFFDIRLEDAPAQSIAFVPANPTFSLILEGSLNNLSARLQSIYPKRIITAGLGDPNENFTVQDPENPSRFLTRNLPAESRALARLVGSGFEGPDTTGRYVLSGERQVLTFLARELPRLQREWSVSLGAQFKNASARIDTIKPRIEFSASGESWFDMNLSLAAPGGERFSAAEIQRLLQMGQSHVRLKNGRTAVFDTAILDELQAVLLDCAPAQTQPGHYRIDRMHAAYIDAALSGQPGVETAGSPPWRTPSGKTTGPQAMAPIPLGDLEQILRPYQKHGVYWMSFLAANGFGGILADEMGLGKTVQALAFLRSLNTAPGGAPAPGPSLIVCPSSLVHNWHREAERFCPELSVLLLEGPDRHELFGRAGESHLLVTSYPLLRRDIDRYRSIPLAAVVLDEAQHIKNPDTQNAQAAGALKAGHRFVLTGTPMENSVRDLWSIMNFLMPGYLGARDDFRDRYELPIGRGDGASVTIQARLAKRLRPFMLRRLKREVAPELPEKLEQVAYCDLSPQQFSVYEELLRASRTQIDAATSEKNDGKARMLVLTALLRLRQACCDLRLLNLDGIDPAQSSAKLDLLDELLQEAIDGGHRVLIFSQFVSMLALIRDHLQTSETPFCYLDGATKDRQTVVDRFQTDPAIPIFLISLKAGGTGLNLTGADTVIHFDPWWNPAVEAQATDRAHRIGQKNVVTSYKLIARGTVEEKILNLQRKKRDVIDATVESEEPLLTSLTMSEIHDLLS